MPAAAVEQCLNCAADGMSLASWKASLHSESSELNMCKSSIIMLLCHFAETSFRHLHCWSHYVVRRGLVYSPVTVGAMLGCARPIVHNPGKQAAWDGAARGRAALAACAPPPKVFTSQRHHLWLQLTRASIRADACFGWRLSRSG